MKIAVFTNQFPGPVNTFFIRDIIGLKENGFDITIFSLYPINKKYWRWSFSINGKSINKDEVIHVSYLTFIKDLYLLKNDIRRIFATCLPVCKASTEYGVIQFIKTFIALCMGVSWYSIYKDCDAFNLILSYWGNYSGTSAFIAHKLLGQNIPYVFFLHAGTDLYRDQIYLKEKIFYADKIIIVCEYNKRFLRDLYPRHFTLIEKKLVVHHLGLNLNSIKYTFENREDNLLLGIGRFDQCKGFTYLVRAFKLLYSKEKKLQLVLIGNGDEKNKLMVMVKKMGLEENVKFTGWIDFSSVKEYITRATVLIHPSSEIGDAVPTVIKEALASGLPVVGTQIAGIPELLNNSKCGVLVPPKNAEAIAAAVSKLLYDKALRRNLSMKGRKFAEEKFNMEKNSRILSITLLNLIKDLK